MRKCRIVERTNVNRNKEFVIQQKHFLFRWWWVDAWINSWDGASCQDSFSSLKEAEDNLCYFNGKRCKDKIIKED